MITDKDEIILNLIYLYGGVDGAHYKQWLLNEIVKTATETEEKYKKWINHYCDGENGPETYFWDIGIAPYGIAP